MIQEPRDKSILKALAVLRESPEGHALHDWMSGELKRLRDENQTMADDVRMRWGQGAIQALDGLLELLNKARGNVDIIQHMRGKRGPGVA